MVIVTSHPMLNDTTTISLHIRKLAAVAYVPLIGPVVWYGHKHDAFIRWHAIQGSAVSLYLITAYLVPYFGQYLALMFGAVAVIGFIRAMHGELWRVPLLGDFLAMVLSRE